MKKIFIGIIALQLVTNMLATAQTVPVPNKGRYSFNFKGTYFEVDPKSGGRISSFKIKNKELLYTDTTGKNNNWGSTFWPAPQSVWGWPPHDTLDSSPYSASVKSGVLTIKSMDKKQGLHCRFEKIFRMNEADQCVSVTYKIVNTGKVADTLGPWQIARIPSGGLTFFPKGLSLAKGKLLPLMKDINDVSWFVYDSAYISKDPNAVPKLFSDGTEGWIAHVNKDRNLIVFRFEDTPVEQKSPGEDEIEIYTNPNLTYTEVEPLGPYKIIPAGQSHSWTVKWYARQVPANIVIKPGNQELAKFVRVVIGTVKETVRK
ncbi:MAG: hypothetical protein H7329_07600 [Opitutaceae bacterium]|nr:hypothetical protein [Cytophagales bacterium]